MNSDMIAENFANSDKLQLSSHYITLVSDVVSYEHPTAKFVMTYATPNASLNAFNQSLPKSSTSNIINSNKPSVSRITASNYIEVTVPRYFFYITKLEIITNLLGCGKGGIGSCNPKIVITRKEYRKGQRFVVTNAGGSVDTPCIIGIA